jgi:HD superfamily phosphohydrolase
MAALCHDIGHLPFSHAAEKELLPGGYDHERLTKDLIYSEEMEEIWNSMTPPLKSDHIVKLAVGPKKASPLELDTWETVLAEIIIGDAFGAIGWIICCVILTTPEYLMALLIIIG